MSFDALALTKNVKLSLTCLNLSRGQNVKRKNQNDRWYNGKNYGKNYLRHRTEHRKSCTGDSDGNKEYRIGSGMEQRAPNTPTRPISSDSLYAAKKAFTSMLTKAYEVEGACICSLPIISLSLAPFAWPFAFVEGLARRPRRENRS